jgi:hypothetical protein
MLFFFLRKPRKENKMRRSLLALSTPLFLAACGSAPEHGDASHGGRYLGIGVFSVGELWSKMAGGRAAPDAASATIEDDEHVIVVVDSKTGEIRECGDLSGRCISMNPWTSASGEAPVRLTKHAPDAVKNDMVANTTTP